MNLGSLSSFLPESSNNISEKPVYKLDRRKQRARVVALPSQPRETKTSRQRFLTEASTEGFTRSFFNTQEKQPKPKPTTSGSTQKPSLSAKKGVEKRTLDLVESRVRGELLMRNHHYLLKTLKKKTEDEMELDEPVDNFENQVSLFFNKDHFNRPKSQTSNRTQPICIENPHKKVLSSTQDAWLRHRGNSIVPPFAVNMFKMLDPDNKGEIDAEVMIENFLALGVTWDAVTLAHILCRLLKVKDMSGVKIKRDVFFALFKTCLLYTSPSPRDS